MTRPRLRATARGFTLIEVMITVALIGILASIAVPAYQDSVWKGKRGEAKAAMVRVLQAEERYYTNMNTYVAYTTTPPSSAFPTFSADSALNSRYTIKVVTNGVTGMCTDNDITKCAIVVATVNGTVDPRCGATLSMDTVGNKSSAVTNAVCWR